MTNVVIKLKIVHLIEDNYKILLDFDFYILLVDKGTTSLRTF